MKALRVVEPPTPEPAKDIYAADRAKALDLQRWRRIHERSEKREPIFIPDRPRVKVLGHITVTRGRQ